jgi:hypothetical protein
MSCTDGIPRNERFTCLTFWQLTSAFFFDKLRPLAGVGTGYRMTENAFLSCTTADNLEQVFRLVEAGKLESGL